MAHLHPRGVNHLALSTADMKRQLTFWCDTLGLPLKALYWMHGVQGAWHGFVELAPDSYVAFVQHPDNTSEVEFGVSHADGPGGECGRAPCSTSRSTSTRSTTCWRCGTGSAPRAFRCSGPSTTVSCSRSTSRGPRGSNLEVCTGTDIDERAWIDPEVVGLCGISDEELEAMTQPASFDRPSEPVAQPTEPHPDNARAAHDPERYALVAGLDDSVIWARSETTPPVQVD